MRGRPRASPTAARRTNSSRTPGGGRRAGRRRRRGAGVMRRWRGRRSRDGGWWAVVRGRCFFRVHVQAPTPCPGSWENGPTFDTPPRSSTSGAECVTVPYPPPPADARAAAAAQRQSPKSPTSGRTDAAGSGSGAGGCVAAGAAARGAHAGAGAKGSLCSSTFRPHTSWGGSEGVVAKGGAESRSGDQAGLSSGQRPSPARRAGGRAARPVRPQLTPCSTPRSCRYASALATP
jgi:hypothetical protein